MDGFSSIIEIALLLLIAFVIGCGIGWLLRDKIFRIQASSSGLPAENSARPKALSAPGKQGKDNLKRIKGLGPVLEGKLNELGIFRLDQIAAWDKQTIDWVDNELSFKGRIERDRWVEQARELMD